MRKARHAGTVALFKDSPGVVPHALLACALIAGPATGAVTHTLLPWKAQAGKAFDMMLDGRYPCNFAYSHESTYVSKDRIVLAFLATEDPAIRCAPPTEPSGPEFHLPSLNAGEYPVYSQALEPCMVGPAPCDLHVEPVLVGTLQVTSGPAYDTGWFLHPRRVESGKDVRVTLLNMARGTCEFEFNPARDTLRFRVMELSFSTRIFRLGRLCETSVHPFGPAFRLGDLAPGSYRVEAFDIPLCAFQDPACLPTKPYTPVLVDTLVVGSATALTTLGPVPERPSGSAARLRRLPGGLGVVLQGRDPTGLGFKVERIVAPDGRRVGP